MTLSRRCAVDQRAVAGAEIAHAIAAALGVDGEVAARHGDVGEHQVLIGAASDARLGQYELVGLAAVGSPDDVQNRRLRHRANFTTCYKRFAMRRRLSSWGSDPAGRAKSWVSDATIASTPPSSTTPSPTEPLLFFKPPSAIIESGQPIVRPRG